MIKNNEPIPEINTSTDEDYQKTLIQCERVSLRECNLSAVNPEEHKDEPPVQFAIQPVVFGNDKMVSELKVCASNFRKNAKVGFILNFTMVAYFRGSENTTKEQLGEFGQLYTLSILWPYAREFAQDMFMRSGFPGSLLPVINPTATTEDMMKQKMIEVIYQEVNT